MVLGIVDQTKKDHWPKKYEINPPNFYCATNESIYSKIGWLFKDKYTYS